RATAATQVLHHFALLAMKSALDKMSKTNPIAIESFTTHSLRKTQAVLRLVERNHGAVITIQKLNRYGKEARREFLKEAFRIDEEFG
ncbi:MAG: hypothetical protein QFX35_07435, partial [Candidatus Verstraetearchaeota archaeon]|nr:hypothetical protein [Candidatus Verstraetearchaeota archaeon]